MSAGAKLELPLTSSIGRKPLKIGAKLTVRVRVKEIGVGSDGGVTGVVYFGRRGELYMQPACVVVVCCHGIGTPRLMLASKSARFPDGLASSNGHVGRHFMNHPSRYVEGVSTSRSRPRRSPGIRSSASSSTKLTATAGSCAATR